MNRVKVVVPTRSQEQDFAPGAQQQRQFVPSGAADASVIICAYTEQRFDLLMQAITSVREQTIPPSEVIVVVDHNPQLHSMLQEAQAPALIIENPRERGANNARNAALALAGGAFVAFLDDDAQAEPTWLEELLGGFSDPDVLGVGGFIEPIWDAPRPAWFPDEFLWVVGCSYRGLPATPARVRNLISCNMAVRSRVCEEIGGFRSDIGHVGGEPRGNDETEFCIRARQRWPHGHFLYQPSARVRHHVPGARTQWQYYLRRCRLEGMSKANLVDLVGNDGTSTERSYVRRTLPRGVVRGIMDLCIRGDVSGMKRSIAIACGLWTTTRAFIGAWLKAHSDGPLIY